MSPFDSSQRPTYALVSTDIRRDLLVPLRHFTRLRIVHLYRRATYGDLAPGETADHELIHYRSAWDLLRRLRRLCPDIVQGVEPFSLRLLPCLYAVYAVARLNRLPLFLIALENRPAAKRYHCILSSFLRMALKPVFRYARAIIHLNEGARRNALWVGAEERKLHRLMYGTWGIDPLEFHPEGDRRSFPFDPDPVVLFAGRLHPEKGVFVLLEAFGLVHEKQPSVKLVLAGDGPAKQSLAAVAGRRGLTEAIVLAGIVPNREMPSYLRRAEVLVAPSIVTPKWEEQVGMSILQAMGCAVPVVSTRSGAIPEYLPESAGLLTPESDPQALAEALLTLLGDSKLRKKLGAAGREHALKHYDAERNVRAAEAFILKNCHAHWD